MKKNTTASAIEIRTDKINKYGILFTNKNNAGDTNKIYNKFFDLKKSFKF